ncbi:MAG: hypothetical protein HKO71_08430 [Pseudomonadales bacterium]|nr:hypothetical protein [Pseudomonadales bacterium]
MTTSSLRKSINCAFRYALDKKHEFITVEHLLLALLQNCEVAVILHRYQINIRELHYQLVDSIERHTPVLHPEDPSLQTHYTVHRRTQPTVGMERLLQRARFLSECAGYTEIAAAHTLLALFGEQESPAVYLLRQQGLQRSMVAEFIQQHARALPQKPSYRHLKPSYRHLSVVENQ